MNPSHALFALLIAHGCTTVSADPAKQSSEIRKVGDFRAIEIAGVIEVEAKIDKATRVEVSGDADLLKQVTTDVKNGTLVVDTKGRLHETSHLKVTLTAPDLSALSISGTGSLTVTGLANAKLDVSMPGTGSMTLAGTTTALDVTIAGTGELSAKKLVTKSTTIDIKGTGSATVHATQALTAKINGTGAITVHGHPATVKKSINGMGSIDVR